MTKQHEELSDGCGLLLIFVGIFSLLGFGGGLLAYGSILRAIGLMIVCGIASMVITLTVGSIVERLKKPPM